MAGRKDILDRLWPSLTAQMRLWWDLVSEDGYGYNWGRSQGVVSYLDTPEIVGFLASHAEFRPASLADIAALYYQAWNYLQNDYRADAHLLSIFAFGRGNYAYISREREWQQTTGFFGKLANSHTPIVNALAREGVTMFPVAPTLGPVARFEFFRKPPARAAGVWLVRQGDLRFALPITTGPRPGISDYLPAPYGLPGFAAPVEQAYPVVTPYLELADGRVVVATDGADAIEPAADGRSLRVRWNRWAVVGTKSGELQDVGLESVVVWRLEEGTLVREETLSSKQPVTIKQWRMAVPSTHDRFETVTTDLKRIDRFSSTAGSLEVHLFGTTFNPRASIVAAGNGPLGRGVKGAIPLHLVFEAQNIIVSPDKPLTYKLSLRPKGVFNEPDRRSHNAESNHTGNLFCPQDARRERQKDLCRARRHGRALPALRPHHARRRRRSAEVLNQRSRNGTDLSQGKREGQHERRVVSTESIRRGLRTARFADRS